MFLIVVPTFCFTFAVSTLNALIDKLQLAKECACSTGCKYRNGAVKVGVAIVRRIMLPDGTCVFDGMRQHINYML